jgi:hypothetical protein
LVAWFIYAQTKPLSSSDLKIPISESRSKAAAAQLLTTTTQAGKTVPAFYEAQIIMLRQKVDETASQLATAKVENGLEIKLWQAQRLIGELKTTLERLETAFGKPDQLELRRQELDELVPRLRELEDTLN